MNEMALVNVFDSRDHLIDEHERCFQGELSLTVIEQVFQRWAQEFNDENVERAFVAVVVHFRETRGTLKYLVDLMLVVRYEMSLRVRTDRMHLLQWIVEDCCWSVEIRLSLPIECECEDARTHRLDRTNQLRASI